MSYYEQLALKIILTSYYRKKTKTLRSCITKTNGLPVHVLRDSLPSQTTATHIQHLDNKHLHINKIVL